VKNYRLIADYKRRNFYVTWLESIAQVHNDAIAHAEQVIQNNRYCARWLTYLNVALCLYQGGSQVVTGETSLGLFITNLEVLGTIGSLYSSIYELILQLQSCFGALHRITRFMNLPIDIHHRKQLAEQSIQLTSDLRAEARASMSDFKGTVLDLLPIRVENLRFSYPGHEELRGLAAGKFHVYQGNLISIIGPHGEGKSTLLKILGGVILPQIPENSLFFVPSHLHVLHVASQPLFCQGSLMRNLSFGLSESEVDADRVKRVCSLLDLPEEVMAYINSEAVEQWSDVLSQSQAYLVCLARALITDPELLCIHKPTLNFDERASENILSVLRRFVDERGVAADSETKHLRRPRTCIMSSSKRLGVALADEVYHVSVDGIRLIQKEDIEEDMFA